MDTRRGLLLCFEKLKTIKCADDSDESVEQLISDASDLLNDHIKKNICKLQLFFLDDEFEKNIDKFSFECLPPAITFETSDEPVALVPSPSCYTNSMHQPAYMSYCSILSIFRELLGKDASIRITNSREYVNFELEKNVWLDFLVDKTDTGPATYWWNQEATNKKLKEQLATPEGFCELMVKHNVEHLQYNSFVRYDDGAYVCHTFTGFSEKRQTVVSFQIYPFDRGAYHNWFNSVKRLAKFKIQQSSSFEYNWGISGIDKDDLLDYYTPVYPEKVEQRYGLLLAITQHTEVQKQPVNITKSKTVRFKGDSKILSSAFNTSPEISGFIMPPTPIKFTPGDGASVTKEIFATAEKWFNEAFEMGFDLDSSDKLYGHMLHEAALQLDEEGQYLMVSFFVLEHPQVEIDDFIISKALPSGPVTDQSVVEEMNRMFPNTIVTDITFVPLFRGS